MTRTRAILRTLALGLALILSGCPSPEADAGGPIHLIYWPPTGEFDVKLAKELVGEWNAAHPGVQIEMHTLPAGRSSEEVLLAAIVGNTTPDICSNILTGTVERMVRAGAVVPLSDFEDFDQHVDDRSPAGTRERFQSSDGKVYQLPYKTNPAMLLYNTKLFAAAGVTPPRTYSEFLAAAAKLSGDDDGDGRPDRWAIGLEIDNTWWKRLFDLYPLYLGASRGTTLIDGKQVLFEGEPMVEAMSFMRELFAKGYAPRSSFVWDLFMQERIAMLPGSGPSIPGLEKNKPEGFEYGLMRFPVPDDHPPSEPVNTFGDIKSIVVFDSCQHPQEAWEFLKFITSREADFRLMEVTSQLPLRKDLQTEEPYKSYLDAHPLLAKVAEQVDAVRGTDDTVHLVEIFDTLSQTHEAAVIYQVVETREGVESAVSRVKRLLEMWD